MLHVASKETVTIERDDTGEVVCTSPCDTKVPASTKYHVGGHRPGPSFTLAGANGRADIHVKAGSKAEFWTGIGGVAVGGLLVAGGAGTLIYGMANRDPVGGADSETADHSYTDVMIAGTVMVLAGIFVGLGGGAFAMTNASTEVWGNVQKHAGTTQDAQPSKPPSARAVALPRPTFVSIFSGTF
jgi:hypothetical protein